MLATAGASGGGVGATAAATDSASSGAASAFGLSAALGMENQFFTGGLGLAALGAMAGAARGLSSAGMAMAKRHLLVTLEVTSKDTSYPWVLNWLGTHGRRPQHLSVNTLVSKRSGSSSGFELVPGPGKYPMRYQGRYLWVERSRAEQAVAMADGKPWERVTLTGLGSDISVFETLLGEARAMATRQTVRPVQPDHAHRPFV
eukprot:SAG11_NODE_108_length_16386_cov_20.828329_7_plen_202_part_00